ncbi:MAG: hypothetical protein QOF13_2590 [Solirubrobacterales bacterium]|jgi:hypothetical protein|nr:hypothetical protein [Solirubrobacterales bacterium]
MLGRKFTRYLERRDEEGRARWAELKKLGEKAEARTEENREFNREILLRNEKVYTSLIAQMEKNSRRIDEGTKQLRANTQAVLSVLDRFNGSSS